MKKLAPAFAALRFILPLLWASATWADPISVIVFDTGLSSIGDTGQFVGTSVGDSQYLGVRFQSPGNIHTTEVGLHLGAPVGDTFFGAIVKLSGPSDLPDSTDLSTDDVLRHTVFS